MEGGGRGIDKLRQRRRSYNWIYKCVLLEICLSLWKLQLEITRNNQVTKTIKIPT